MVREPGHGDFVTVGIGPIPTSGSTNRVRITKTGNQASFFNPETWKRLFETRSRFPVGFLEFVDCGIDA